MPATVRQRVKEVLDPAVLGDPSAIEFLVTGGAPAGFDAEAACGLLLRPAQGLNRVVYMLADEIDALRAAQSS
jgi:hypothetical protein